MDQSVIKTLEKHLKKDDTVIAGISGGADSIYLLHLLANFSEKTPIKIIVAHINHRLRKKDSTDDENFVKDLVETLNSKAQLGELKFYSTTKNIKALSQKSKKGIEETGRDIRYKFFQSLAIKNKARFIITAHHADDNLETIILNFTRGATLQGLIGIQELTPLTKTTQLLRPLLNISKKDITSYLKSKELKYREDKSNSDTTYKRNFIRHKVIPELKKANPNITETTAKNIKNLREIDQMLTQEADTWLNQQKPQGLDAKSFRTLHPALQKTILRQAYKNLIGNTQNLESIHLDEILTLINQNVGNKKKKLGKLTFSIKQNTISIENRTKKVQYGNC